MQGNAPRRGSSVLHVGFNDGLWLCPAVGGHMGEADTRRLRWGRPLLAATLEGGMVLNWPMTPLRHRILVFGGLQAQKGWY